MELEKNNRRTTITVSHKVLNKLEELRLLDRKIINRESYNNILERILKVI